MDSQTSAKNKDAPKTLLKGVNRAVQILEYVAVHKGRATDIATSLGISWATLARTLSQLEQGGFLKKNSETNQYSIGSRLWFLGSTYVADHTALEMARPYLAQLASSHDSTVQYVERSGGQSSVLLSLNSREPITKATYGYHFPLHAGSKGLVLLAHASEDFIEEYLAQPLSKLTPNTEIDPVKIYKSLLDIREKGYSVSVADVQPFTGSVTAPIRNAHNQVVAAISMIFRKSVLQQEEVLAETVEILIDASMNISMSLGWRP